MLDMKSVWEGLGFTRLRVPTVRAVFQVVYCADDIKAAEAADRKDEKFVRPRSGGAPVSLTVRAAFPTASTLSHPDRVCADGGACQSAGDGARRGGECAPTPGTPTAATAQPVQYISSRTVSWASCLHSQLARLAKQGAAQIAIVAAVQALASLRKADITEVSRMRSPPEGVKTVADVITMLIDQSIAKPDWKIAKKIMGGSKFLSQLCQFDLDGVKWSTVAVSMVKCIPHLPL